MSDYANAHCFVTLSTAALSSDRRLGYRLQLEGDKRMTAVVWYLTLTAQSPEGDTVMLSQGLIVMQSDGASALLHPHVERAIFQTPM